MYAWMQANVIVCGCIICCVMCNGQSAGGISGASIEEIIVVRVLQPRPSSCLFMNRLED